MAEEHPDPHGTARTLQGVVFILLVGIALGLGYNALGRASRPPRGLSWLGQPARLRSLEAMLPAADSTAAAVRPSPAPGAAPAGTNASPGAGAAAPSPTASSPLGPHPGRTPAARGNEPAPTSGSESATGTAGTTPTPAPQSPAPGTSAPSAGGAPAPAVQSGLPQVPDSDEPIEVQLATVRKFFDAGAALIVDARGAAEYAEGHIPGALSLPYDDVAAKPQLLDAVRGAKQPIIVYCEGPGCDLSRSLAITMLSSGIRKVLVFTAGFPEWKSAGYAIERGSGGR